MKMLRLFFVLFGLMIGLNSCTKCEECGVVQSNNQVVNKQELCGTELDKFKKDSAENGLQVACVVTQ
jgi:hypothetical protein